MSFLQKKTQKNVLEIFWLIGENRNSSAKYNYIKGPLNGGPPTFQTYTMYTTTLHCPNIQEFLSKHFIALKSKLQIKSPQNDCVVVSSLSSINFYFIYFDPNH